MNDFSHERKLQWRDSVWASVITETADGIQVGYTPSREQWIAHQDPSRFKLVGGGVGGGKSYWLAREADYYSWEPNGLGWIIGPTYELARPEFDYLLEAYRHLGAVDETTVSNPQKGPCRFKTRWGFEWVTKSSDKPEELAGRRPHVIIATEAAQQPRGIMAKLRERAAEKRAPIIMAGTFEEGYGWYSELFDRWSGPNPEGGKSFSLPTWSNLAKYPGGRNDPEILAAERDMPYELFMERFGGVPCKPAGLVFKEYDRAVHVRPLAELFDPGEPVQLWTDPATHCYPILFVQLSKPDSAGIRTVHVLDEIYAKDQIGQQVIPQVIHRRIPIEVRQAVYGEEWQEKPATWWEHSCTSGVMDIAGTFRQGGNKSQVVVWKETLEELKTHPIYWRSVKVNRASEWYDVLHLRLMHSDGNPPRMLFADHLDDRVGDDDRANGILGELKSHRWPKRNEMSAEAGRPLKRNEDALSAAGYGCLVNFGPVLVRRKVTGRRKIRSYYG